MVYSLLNPARPEIFHVNFIVDYLCVASVVSSSEYRFLHMFQPKQHKELQISFELQKTYKSFTEKRTETVKVATYKKRNHQVYVYILMNVIWRKFLTQLGHPSGFTVYPTRRSISLFDPKYILKLLIHYDGRSSWQSRQTFNSDFYDLWPMV